MAPRQRPGLQRPRDLETAGGSGPGAGGNEFAPDCHIVPLHLTTMIDRCRTQDLSLLNFFVVVT